MPFEGKKDLIVIVCDRSGSMAMVSNSAESAVNEFIHKQKMEEGQADVMLVEFDDEIDVYPPQDIQKISQYRLRPRGLTALNDAIGKSIVEAKKIRKDYKKVIFVIQTDGGENSSKEFRSGREVKSLVEKSERKHDFNFIFLGSGINVAQVSSGFGISTSINYANNDLGNRAVYDTACAYTSSLRTGGTKAQADQLVADAKVRHSTLSD